MLRTLAFLVGLFLAGAATAQQTRYVSPTGTDAANDCLTQATPCLTIQRGIDQAAPGDIVDVAVGNYAEEIVIDRALTVRGPQAGQPYAGRNFASGLEANLYGGAGEAVVQIAHSDVVFEGLSVRSLGLAWAGIRINPTAATGDFSNITIQDNLIGGVRYANPSPARRSYASGIYAEGDDVGGTHRQISGLLIENNAFEGIGWHVYSPTQTSGGAGIFLYDIAGAAAGDGAVIQNNAFIGMFAGVHNGEATPGLGVAVSDAACAPASGVRVTGNTYFFVFGAGFAVYASASTVDESSTDYTSVPMLGINGGKLATVVEASFSLLTFNDVTPGYPGSRVYFSDPLQPGVSEIALSGGGTPTLSRNDALLPSTYILTENGVEVFRRSFVLLPLVITGTGGDDTLTLDFSMGPPIPAGGVTFDGGAGDDALATVGGFYMATQVAYTFTNANDGTIAYDGATVTYTGLEPILDGVNAVGRTFNFGPGADVITLSDDATPFDFYSQIVSPSAETVVFRAPIATLTVNAGDGANVVTLQAMDVLQGGTIVLNGGIDGDSFDVMPSSTAQPLSFEVTVAGGDPAVAPGDALTLQASLPGATIINAGGAGTITFTAARTVTFTGIESVPKPDLELGATSIPATTFPASSPDVVFTLSNAGVVAVGGIEVTVAALPAGLTYVSNAPSQGTYNSATRVWTVGSVGNGNFVTLSLQVQVISDVDQPVQAEVTAQDDPDLDSTPGDGVGDDFVSTLIDVGELSALPSGALALAVTFDALGRTYAGSHGFGAFRSAGTGTWTAINTGLTNPFVWDLQAHLPSGNVVAGTLGGGLYRTTDQGTTWTSINLGARNIRGVTQGPSPLYTLYATGDLNTGTATAGTARVWRSTDAGLTWTELPGFTRTLVEPWRVAVDPNNANVLYLGTRKGIYKSTDGGQTWNPTGFFGKSADAYGLLVTNAGVVIAGVRDGIIRSLNGGATWSGTINPVPGSRARNTYDIAYHPVSNRIYLALYGRPGVVVSSDGGTTFFDVPLSAPPGAEVLSVAVKPDGNLLVSFTDGSVKTVSTGAATAVETVEAPPALVLDAPAPNPSRGQARVRYGLTEPGMVRLSVYDALGREVARLAEGEQAAGWHTASFEGAGLGAGVYVVRLVVGGRMHTRTLNLVR